MESKSSVAKGYFNLNFDIINILMAIEETKKFAKPSKLPFYFVLVCLFAVYLLGSIQLYKLLVTRNVSNVLRAIGEFITNNFIVIKFIYYIKLLIIRGEG
jgi:hypothetical protein